MNRHDRSSTGNAGIAIIRLTLIAAATLLLASLVPLDPGPAQAGLKATAYALAAVVGILLLRPSQDLTLFTIIVWSAAGAGLVAVFLLVDSTTRMLLPYLPRLLLTLFLLAATFSIATRYVPAPLVITLFVMATLMPVWAAPLVEVSGNPAWLNKFVVNACPLTAIAITVDLDYLRSAWFYANSALGSMRYSYPAWSNACLLLAIVPAAAVIRERRRTTPATLISIRKEVHP